MKWVPSQFGTKEMQDRVERCMGTSTERSFRIGFLWLGTQRYFVGLGLVPAVQHHCLRCRVSRCYSAQEVFHVALSPGPSKGLLCARHQPHGQCGLVFREWLVERKHSLLILFPWLCLSEPDWAKENSMRNGASEFLFQTSPTLTKKSEKDPHLGLDLESTLRIWMFYRKSWIIHELLWGQTYFLHSVMS